MEVVNLSLSMRVLVNAEALNMAESVGNYTRHRKAPVVFSAGNGEYSVIYVPAVSGESIAHSYQQILANIAQQRNLPVAKYELNGYFMKFSDDKIISKYYKEELAKVLGVKPDDAIKKLKEMEGDSIEEAILKTSVVADVGGFLYTEGLVKRTAAIRFSYLLPALDALEKGGASILPQLHVRYTPGAEKGEQTPFYVESGSALYTLTADLVASDIGKTSAGKTLDNARQRVEAAIDALIALVDGMLFGAKRSRYLPQWDVRSILASVSKGPVEFVVSPGVTKDYVKETYERALAITNSISNMEVHLYAYTGNDADKPSIKESKTVSYEEGLNHTDVLTKAKSKVLSLMGK